MSTETRNVYMNHCCGHCTYFLREDALGAGFCQVRDRAARCGDCCSLRYDTLTDRQIIRLLHDHQRWRTGANIPMMPPFMVSIGINAAIRKLREMNKHNHSE